MKKFVEKKQPIEALQWNGFISMPELVEMKGDATNILLRHDESILIFDKFRNQCCFSDSSSSVYNH